jgi:plastocyanin
VKEGTTITFNGNFGAHNLSGGTVTGGVGTPAAMGTSPFMPATTSGNTKSFTMTALGTFPYYCVQHTGQNMSGAVFVVP